MYMSPLLAACHLLMLLGEFLFYYVLTANGVASLDSVPDRSGTQLDYLYTMKELCFSHTIYYFQPHGQWHSLGLNQCHNPWT